jgi:hypothetical protein
MSQLHHAVTSGAKAQSTTVTDMKELLNKYVRPILKSANIPVTCVVNMVNPMDLE